MMSEEQEMVSVPLLAKQVQEQEEKQQQNEKKKEEGGEAQNDGSTSSTSLSSTPTKTTKKPFALSISRVMAKQQQQDVDGGDNNNNETKKDSKNPSPSNFGLFKTLAQVALLKEQQEKEEQEKAAALKAANAANDSDDDIFAKTTGGFDEMPELDEQTLDNLNLSDDQLVQMVVLRQVIERYRFLIPSERVDDEVSEESLTWMLRLDDDCDPLRSPSLGATTPPASSGVSRETSLEKAQEPLLGSSSHNNDNDNNNNEKKKKVDDDQGEKNNNNNNISSSSSNVITAASISTSASTPLSSQASSSSSLKQSVSNESNNNNSKTSSSGSNNTSTSLDSPKTPVTPSTTGSAGGKKKIDLDELEKVESTASSSGSVSGGTSNNNSSNENKQEQEEGEEKKVATGKKHVGFQLDDENETSPSSGAVINVEQQQQQQQEKKKSKIRNILDDDDEEENENSSSAATTTAGGGGGKSKLAARLQKAVRKIQAANAFVPIEKRKSLRRVSATGDVEFNLPSASASSAPSSPNSLSLHSEKSGESGVNSGLARTHWREVRKQMLEEKKKEEEEKARAEKEAEDAENAKRNAAEKVVDGGIKLAKKGLFGVVGAALDTVKTVGTGVKDSAKGVMSDFRDVAADLGIVKKAEDTQELSELAKELWERCKGVKGVTFRKCLEFDLEHFPYTTEEQRKILRRHEENHMVSRLELAFDLQIEVSHPILKCIFGTLNELPRIVYQRLVSCLHEHPHRYSFSMICAQKSCEAKKNMSLMFSYMIMFIITLIIVPHLDVPSMFLVSHSSYDALSGEFPNGCPTNSTDPRCFMVRRTIDDVKTVDEILVFCRKFLVTELWPEDPIRASQDTFYGNVRVGALLMRVAPLVDSPSRASRPNPNERCPLLTCSDLNLSTSVYEFRVSASFDCSSFDFPNSTLVVPFNTTQSEALELTNTFNPELCEEEDASVVVSYALYQPSQQILALTQITFTVLKSGAVLPRSYTQTMNLKATQLIEIFAGCHFFIFTWLFAMVVFRRGDGYERFFTAQMIAEYILVSLNLASLFLISSLPPIDEILKLSIQADYVPKNVDHYVATYSLAMDILAWWVLLFYCMCCTSFSSVIGLNVLTHLLRVTAADVAVLLVLFTVISSSFLGIARCLFGFSTAIFSFSSTSVLYLLQFLWGIYDFDTVVQQSPVAGVAFFFCYLTFISAFLLNILIAVITARLEDMRERANLHLELYSNMQTDSANFEDNEHEWFSTRTSFLPIMNAVIDALPFIGSTLRWKEFHRITRGLFSPLQRRKPLNPRDLVRSAMALVDFSDVASPGKCLEENCYWNTALRRAVDTYDCIPDRVSWVLIERVILSQSRSDMIRDAALIRVLIAFDESNTDIERIIEYQQEQERQCVASRERLTSGISKRHERFELAWANLRTKLDHSHNPGDGGEGKVNLSHLDGSGGGDGDSQPNLGRRGSSSQQLGLLRRASKPDATAAAASAAGGTVGGGSTFESGTVSLADTHQPAPSSSSSSFSPADNNNDKDNSKSGQFSQEGAGHSHHATFSLGGAAGESGGGGATTASGKPADVIAVQSRRKRASSRYSVSAKRLRFLVNQWLVRQIKGSLYFPLRSLLTLSLFLGFFFSLLLYSEASTWLGENLKRGVVDFPYTTKCDDIDCKEGNMFEKRFSDVGNSGEIEEFIERLFIPRVMPDVNTLDFVEPAKFKGEHINSTSWPVSYDRYIRNINLESSPFGPGRVFVRQLLALPQKCELPRKADLIEYNSSSRTRAFEDMQCYVSPGIILGQFQTGEKTRPSDSLLDESAYKFQDKCVENAFVLGSFDLYPCSGYTAVVHNKSQLEYIPQWLDPAAKLVVISTSFKSTYTDLNKEWEGRQLLVRLDLYFEMAPGGGGCTPFFYVSTADQPMFRFSWIGFTLLGVDLLLYLVYLVRYLRILYRGGTTKARSDQHKPVVPWVSVLTAIACIWLASTSSLQTSLRQSWMLSVLVISSTNSLMYDFVFPVAKIITSRAAYLIRSLTLSVRLVLVIIPFFFVISVGFVYSSHLLFGKNVLGYATLRLALQNVGRGLLQDFDLSNTYVQRPLQSVFFSIAFFAVILTVLSNLLLTLVTSAVDEAKRENQIVNYITHSAEFSGYKVYCDEFVATSLAWRLADSHPFRKFLRFAGDIHDATVGALLDAVTGDSKSGKYISPAKARSDAELREVLRNDHVGGAFFVTRKGRFSRPLETFLFSAHSGISFFCLQELADAIKLTRIPETFIFSVALYLARSQATFAQKFPTQITADAIEETKLSSDFSRSKSAAFSGVFSGNFSPSVGSPMSPSASSVFGDEENASGKSRSDFGPSGSSAFYDSSESAAASAAAAAAGGGQEGKAGSGGKKTSINKLDI